MLEKMQKSYSFTSEIYDKWFTIYKLYNTFRFKDLAFSTMKRPSLIQSLYNKTKKSTIQFRFIKNCTYVSKPQNLLCFSVDNSPFL